MENQKKEKILLLTSQYVIDKLNQSPASCTNVQDKPAVVLDSPEIIHSYLALVDYPLNSAEK